MTSLLLDHPWAIGHALDHRSPAHEILFEFDHLVRSTGLRPAPFLDEANVEGLAAYLAEHNIRGSAGARRQLYAIARQLVLTSAAVETASPSPGPIDLSETWKRGLRHAVADNSIWQSPQVVISDRRSVDWENTQEVSVSCSDHSDLCEKLIVGLKSYDTHAHAVTDSDPWKHLEKRHPPAEGAPAHLSKPCWLPRPTALLGVPLDELRANLQGARWKEGPNYFYVPPRDWDPRRVMKEQWRNGRAFPYAVRGTHKGFVDYQNYLWEWHDEERHWDVQVPNDHFRITHEGVRRP